MTHIFCQLFKIVGLEVDKISPSPLSMPSGEILLNGLLGAGVVVLALFALKGAVGILLAPASGGASLIFCF